MSPSASPSAPASTLAPPHLRAQATADLQRALDDLGGPKPDLVGITMRVVQAFRVLGAQREAELLTLELRGHPDLSKTPVFRVMHVTHKWRTKDTGAARRDTRHDPRLVEREGSEIWLGTLQTWVEVAHIQIDTSWPVEWPLDAGVDVHSTKLGRSVHWIKEAHVAPTVFRQRLDEYRAYLYDLVGSWVITLLTATEAGSLWDALREGADGLAAKASVGDGLQAIVRAALGDDPSSWRSGLLACRNVINDLSRYLYQAPGKTYPYIKSGGSEMEVDGEKYRNRLIAYLHQKGLGAADRNVARQHLEWFAGFVAMVNDLGSSGKAMNVDKRDVAIGLMHAYLLIGEIAARTDGEPVLTLVDPASVSGSSSPPA